MLRYVLECWYGDSDNKGAQYEPFSNDDDARVAFYDIIRHQKESPDDAYIRVWHCEQDEKYGIGKEHLIFVKPLREIPLPCKSKKKSTDYDE